jgi:cell division transport system permease protein
MKSLKNHISLIIALFTVLSSVQIYVSIDRTIAAYESHLKDDYSVIVVTNKAFTNTEIKTMSSMIDRSEPISTFFVFILTVFQPQKRLKSSKRNSKAILQLSVLKVFHKRTILSINS